MDGAPLTSYLGAARVVRLEGATGALGGSVSVVLEEPSAPGGTVVRATLAFSYPYRPVVGDQLLVLGDARAFYAIGVLAGRGPARLSNDKGVSVRAEGGLLRLVGDRGVRVTGARVALEAERLGRLALRAVETFGERQRAIRERLTLDAGSIDENADRGWLLQARRVVVKSLVEARIKSTTVRVG
jgi:hypothetical protein